MDTGRLVPNGQKQRPMLHCHTNISHRTKLLNLWRAWCVLDSGLGRPAGGACAAHGVRRADAQRPGGLIWRSLSEMPPILGTDICLGGCMQGAFSIAAKAGVPVVPVTLVGTGGLMPNGQEARLFGGRARVIVHPCIPPSKDADAMMAAARTVIVQSLPPEQR